MARKDGKDRGLFERQPGSGIWWIQYNDPQGRKRREKAGTKAQARALYQKRKAEVLQGRKLPELRKRAEATVAEAIQVHLQEALSRNRGWRDDRRFAAMWKDRLGALLLSQVEPRILEAWKAERSREVAKATVNKELSFLRRVFNVAIQDGWEGANPAERVKFWKLNNRRERQVEAHEEERLRAELPPEALRIVELLILTGARRGELFALVRSDVDLGRGLLRIRDSKSGEGRFIPLAGRAVELFRQQLDSHTSGWVIPSSTGETPLNANNFYNRVWRPALRRAGLADLRIHDLRHTFCSRLAENGESLRVIQRLAGHKSYATTERYAHLQEDALRRAVERLCPVPSPADTNPGE